MPVLEGGLVRPVDEAFLSSFVLDELGIELDRRGHRFCRYEDDTQQHLFSQPPHHRKGMASISRVLADKLRLKVNEPKSAVATRGR